MATAFPNLILYPRIETCRERNSGAANDAVGAVRRDEAAHRFRHFFA
jgi:hypothetical protein